MQPRDLLTAKEAQVALMVWEGLTNRDGRAPSGYDRADDQELLAQHFDTLGVWRRLELALYVASHGGTKWQGDLTPAEESPARIAASGD